eukprot:588002-Amphidinium_carterae.1
MVTSGKPIHYDSRSSLGQKENASDARLVDAAYDSSEVASDDNFLEVQSTNETVEEDEEETSSDLVDVETISTTQEPEIGQPTRLENAACEGRGRSRDDALRIAARRRLEDQMGDIINRQLAHALLRERRNIPAFTQTPLQLA